ncbi:macrophage mannose receptor 1-like [Micropterus dolomieu]|uniref:macrophage mannose receptor 1-like n=1 Tax=Micropterus dolomieu TaxID=147949 RepID=UPI001E8CB6A3|nr:macrophage mannose receptor 1-like [Micropterus dolomieu]XP_045898909.1 macrophage mannose receptor 1-like [Micropterus dolomieu]XP_045898910.1 macrophage mannose receptor 1-like [Micropterus dolomieu]XP_045898911.1 macrophage mannose receptor 1-like [Micropterus dolomieu]
MQWSLFLLILMGQWSFFTCHLYEYHFIGEEKTWDEAQKYCKQNYTDLATVTNMADVRRLLDATGQQREAWIGLYNQTNDNKMWHWSLPGVEFNDSETRWGDQQPNDCRGVENCVCIDPKTSWNDVLCTENYKVICYNETNQSNEFKMIENQMTWPQAQKYCREHHTDLVSGLNQAMLIRNITSERTWIGLFRDTWRWSDGSSSSFRSSDLKLFTNQEGNKKCAMAELNGSGKWDSDDCSKTKPFFCYEDKVILIKESKTWEEALYYCRENYSDLVSITNPHQQMWVQERAKNASTDFVWLGLRYTCTLDLWFWVSNDGVNYTNWDPDRKSDDCGMSGAMDRGGQHQWVTKPDNNKFNFICSKC